ncbi:MAG: ABC transporter permease [Caldilineaceae bacterium]|nr:ABC transporter permease [Caldilineaceae bacterium]
MLPPRWRKVTRDLWHYKMRTVLVVLSIAVGVMGVGMIAGARITLGRDMTAAYQSTSPFHGVIYTENLDPALLRSLARTSGIAQTEARGFVNVRIQSASGGWENLQLEVIDDFNAIRINKIFPIAGAWPPAKQQVLLERASAAELNIPLGDTFTVQTRSAELHTLIIGGVVHDINQTPKTFSGEYKGYIIRETAKTLGFDRELDVLYFTVSERPLERDYILDRLDALKAKLERSGRAINGRFVPEPGKHWADDEVTSMLYLLSALGFLSLFLSGFLVVNTMSSLLTQQVQQIGIMKTVGARMRQLAGVYLGTVVIYGGLSLLVAAPVGALGALGLTRYIASLLNFDVGGFEIPPQALLQEAAIALLTPVLAALYPVIAGTRITAREAISSYGLGKGQFGRSFIDLLLRRIQHLPRPTMLSLRNTFRRKGRLALVLTTLTLASAIFISVLSVQASLLRTLDDALRYWKYDVRLNFTRSYRVEQLQQIALETPGVLRAEGWGFADTVRMRTPDEQGNDVLMIAPPENTQMIDPILLEGRWLLPEDTQAVVMNTDLLSDEPDLRVGGMITLRFDGRDSEWRIVGLIKQPLSGRFVYVNYPTFGRTVHQVDKVNNLRVTIDPLAAGLVADAAAVAELQVGDAQSAAWQTEMAKRLEERFKEAGIEVSFVRTTAQERIETENSLNILVVFLLIMAALLAVVGGLGLMGTMSINVLERTREVGVMRAIGASNGSVLRIVISEGLLIGTLSWLVGGLLSLPLGKVLSDQVGNLFLGAPASYTFSVWGAILWLLLVLLLATLASFLPAWNAARLTVRDTLAYQ